MLRARSNVHRHRFAVQDRASSRCTSQHKRRQYTAGRCSRHRFDNLPRVRSDPSPHHMIGVLGNRRPHHTHQRIERQRTDGRRDIARHPHRAYSRRSVRHRGRAVPPCNQSLNRATRKRTRCTRGYRRNPHRRHSGPVLRILRSQGCRPAGHCSHRNRVGQRQEP